MLAPLEEANESCYNSPMGSYNEVASDNPYANNLTSINSNSMSFPWVNVSLDNIDRVEYKELERIDSDKSQSSFLSESSDNSNSP